MCSQKWESPASEGVSCLEPEFTQTPTDTERTCGISSVMTRRPFGSELRRTPSMTASFGLDDCEPNALKTSRLARVHLPAALPLSYT